MNVLVREIHQNKFVTRFNPQAEFITIDHH